MHIKEKEEKEEEHITTYGHHQQKHNYNILFALIPHICFPEDASLLKARASPKKRFFMNSQNAKQ